MANPQKNQVNSLIKWYYLTRLLGAVGFIYALFFDHSGDRTTLIVASAGLMGLDKVARSDEENKK